MVRGDPRVYRLQGYGERYLYLSRPPERCNHIRLKAECRVGTARNWQSLRHHTEWRAGGGEDFRVSGFKDRFEREVKVGESVFFDRDCLSFPVVDIQEFQARKGTVYWVKVNHPYNRPQWFFDIAVAVDPTPSSRKTYREKLEEMVR